MIEAEEEETGEEAALMIEESRLIYVLQHRVSKQLCLPGSAR